MKNETGKIIEKLTETLELLDVYDNGGRISCVKAIVENCIDELRRVANEP